MHGEAVTFLEHMANNLAIARDRLKEVQDTQKISADKERQEVPFQVGQQVYLNTKNLPLTYSNSSDQRSRKLQDLYDGPFTIVKSSKSPNAWYLDLPQQWNIKQPLNVSLFKRDLSDPTRQRKPPPVKNSIHGAEYLVEAVVDHEDRKKDEKRGSAERYYRLRWTGWDQEHDTWEPISMLEGCSEVVEKYHAKQGWGIPTWPRRGGRDRRKTQKAMEADTII